jgi:glycosyltransferase involved in cell wall biosynthesis
MDFVSFSLDFWDDMWQSRHQIMAWLARDHKVLFVSRPFTFAELIANLRKRELPKSGLTYRGNNLHTLVFSKWLFVIHRFPFLNKLLARLRDRKVRRVIKTFGFQDTVLFIWNPRFVDLVGSFGETITCYYVDDEFASYAGQTETQRKHVLEREDVLLRKSDVVFANGPALLNIKNRYGNVINVPMSADFTHYSKSRLPETRVPSDLEAIPHPRIGYIGNINDKVDLRLLGELATARTDWSIVLIGPAGVRTPEFKPDLERLRSLPNVHLLGFKPRDLLPSYVKGLDVCTMCYRTDGWAYYVYPLKLHEYLASGKPVIGAGLLSLKDFDGVVRIARTTQEWLDHIQEALADHDSARAEARVQVAFENRLEVRVQNIRKVLEGKLKEKKAALPGS